MFNLRLASAVVIYVYILSGCATTGGVPIFTPPAGSLLKLKQEVKVRGNKRIYIQGGQVLERRDVTVINPHCRFVIDRSAEEAGDAISIKPDTFTITEAYRQRDYAFAQEVQYAGRAGSARLLSTVMKLSSADQPEVTQLFCSRWGMLSEAGGGWLTITEMRATLKGVAEIELAE